MTRMRVFWHLVGVMLLSYVCQTENLPDEFSETWEEERDSPFSHVVGRPGENCEEACWTQGYTTCISNPGPTDEVVEQLYNLVRYGQISLWDASWTEDYHPLIEEDGNFVGWDEIPEAGGSCAAYPPLKSQRRLCRCTVTDCEDTFTFCRILRFVCGKYSYTRSMCHATCSTCVDLLHSDPETFATYEGVENEAEEWGEGAEWFEGGDHEGFAP